ncbi:MAG: methyltransferase domain-containing protein [Gammaproteobacteria bacterium]
MDQDDISRLQQEYGLSYHVHYAFLAEQLVGLKGKRVLEVGGSLPDRFVLNELMASQWVALEETNYWAETLSTGYVLGTPPPMTGDKKCFSQAFPGDLVGHNLFYGRIEDLPVSLTGHFDVVFSIAAFEHIARLPLALEKMHQALNSGGKLFALFAPVWSAYNGHHLPEIVDKAGNRWSFGNSPVPPWGHLLLRPMQLYDLLCSKTVSETAHEIVYFVYSSPHITRFFLEDYMDMVVRSPFQAVHMTPMFPVDVPELVQGQLSVRYPGRRNFSHNGLLLVLVRDLA